MSDKKLAMHFLPRAGSPWLLATLLLATGLFLFIGGGELLLLGGSAYYVLTGLAVTAAGILLWRGGRHGMWLYAAMLGWTAIWAFREVGLDGWGLAARLVAPSVLGAWFLLPHVRRGLA